MKIKNYHFSKSFIQALLLIIFMTWLVFKCVPLTEKEQNAKIHSKMERQRLRLAQELDRYTPEEQARLPEFDFRKYSLIKRNARFWLIPREYGGGFNGFGIKWPVDVNKLLKKNWKDDFNGELSFSIFMHSPQYYGDTTDYWGREIYSNTPCKKNPYMSSFRWNGILIGRYSLGVLQKDKNSLVHPKLTDEQYLDICLTSLKILNEKIKEIHFIN